MVTVVTVVVGSEVTPGDMWTTSIMTMATVWELHVSLRATLEDVAAGRRAVSAHSSRALKEKFFLSVILVAGRVRGFTQTCKEGGRQTAWTPCVRA